MQTVALQPVLLRPGLPDLVLRPGMSLTGVVTDRHLGFGVLLLAGVPVVAELPPEIVAGTRLRLRVTDTTGQKATLAVLREEPPGADGGRAAEVAAGRAGESAAPAGPAASAAPASPPPPPVAFALPGGLAAAVLVDPDGQGDGTPGAGARGVTLTLDSPRLGRLTLRLDRGACAVHCEAGPPEEAVRAGRGDLAQALAGALGHPVAVTVHPRHAALDLRA